LFAMKMEPSKEQPMLVTLKSAQDPASQHVIIDPNQIDAKGGTEIDFYVPSLDGHLVAASLSKGGSESGDVHVYDAATGKALADVIPRVNGGTAGGSLAWNADGSGFYYTRYARVGERPAADLDFYQQVYFHKLATKPEQDTYSLGKDFPRIAELVLQSSEDGKYVLARMANGDGGEFAHYVHSPSGSWVQVTRLADEIPLAAFGSDGFLYLLSRQSAPMGKIVRVRLSRPLLADARTVVPESKVAIQNVVPATNQLYVVDQAGGPSQIRIFALDGTPRGSVPLKPISSVGEVLRTKGEEILINSAMYLDLPAWLRLDGVTAKLAPTALTEKGRPISATAKSSTNMRLRRTERGFRSTSFGAKGPSWTETIRWCYMAMAAMASIWSQLTIWRCGCYSIMESYMCMQIYGAAGNMARTGTGPAC
jgi:prolyl oligopeptidase